MNFSARFVGLMAYVPESDQTVTAFFLDPLPLGLPQHLPALAIQSHFVGAESLPADRSIAFGDDDILIWNLDGAVVEILDPHHGKSDGLKSTMDLGLNVGAFGLRANPKYLTAPLSAPYTTAAVVMRTGTFTLTAEEIGMDEKPPFANTGTLQVEGVENPVIAITKNGKTGRIELQPDNRRRHKKEDAPSLSFSSMPTLADQYGEGGTLELVAASGLIHWGDVGGATGVAKSLVTGPAGLLEKIAQHWRIDVEPGLVRCGRGMVVVPLDKG